MTEGRLRARPSLATAIAVAVIAVGVASATIFSNETGVKVLGLVLLSCAVVAELLATAYSGHVMVSAAFVAGVLSACFLGPTAGFLVPALSFAVTWLVERYRWRAFLINVAGSDTPTSLLALVIQEADPSHHGASFVAIVAITGVVTMGASPLIAQLLLSMLDGYSIRASLRSFKSLYVPVAINSAIVALIA